MTFAYVLFRGMYPFNKQKYLMYYLLIAITMMNQGRRDHTKLVSNVFVTYTRGSLGVDLFLKYQSDYWHITMLFLGSFHQVNLWCLYFFLCRKWRLELFKYEIYGQFWVRQVLSNIVVTNFGQCDFSLQLVDYPVHYRAKVMCGPKIKRHVSSAC